MAYQFVYKHVSQLDVNGSGQDNCGPASLARYLLEAYPEHGTTGEWELVGQVRDPKAVPGPYDLIKRIRFLATGIENDPTNNGPISLDQMQVAFKAYGLSVTYTTSFHDADVADWSLLLVDGTALQPALYPTSWFGSLEGQANHFILYMPAGKENDPLAFTNGQQDTSYTLASLQDSFYGAFLLPPIVRAAPGRLVTTEGALKQAPNHTCAAALGPKRQPVWLRVGDRVVPNGRIATTDTEKWIEVVLENSPIHGWYLDKNLS